MQRNMTRDFGSPDAGGIAKVAHLEIKTDNSPPISGKTTTNEEKLLSLKALSQTIVNLRKSKGWNQGELARRLHVSQAHVSRVEAAEDQPSLDMLKQYAEVLEVEPGYLMNIYAGKTKSLDIELTQEMIIRTFLGFLKENNLTIVSREVVTREPIFDTEPSDGVDYNSQEGQALIRAARDELSQKVTDTPDDQGKLKGKGA